MGLTVNGCTPPPAPACTDPCGNDPVKKLSVLEASNTPMAMEFRTAFERQVQSPYFNGYVGALNRTPHTLLRQGFEVDSSVVATQVFDADDVAPFKIAPQADVSDGSLDGIIADWSKQITQLKACTEERHENSDITDALRDNRVGVLNTLQSVVDKGFKPLEELFDKHTATVSKVVIDY